MASSYTGLGTELMTTGENAGTWGTTTNTNIQILEQISGGYTAQDIAGGADTTTLSVSDGSTGAVLAHRIIEFTGTITGNQIVTIPLDVQTFYIVKNNTSGAYTVQFKYVSGSGSSVTWAATDKGTKLLYAAADHASNPNLVDSNIGGVGAVDLDGNELTLDADSDTSITASTDDQIDIEVGGTDRVRITTSAIAPSSADGVALGTSALEFSDLFLADSSVIKFGADQDTTLTHTDGTGLTLNSTNKLTFGDVATYINQSSDGVMTVAGEATIDLTASTAVLVSNDLKLDSDSAVLGFGADNDTTLTHTDGTGLTLNSTNKLLFGDTGTYIHQSADGVLDLVSDTEIEINATTIDINGAVAMDGAITGATNITLSGELDAATGDFSGDVDIDGTLEADAYTLGDAAFIKLAGTNFTGSLLLGHATSGTLDAATYNTGVGIAALDALTTADYNTAIGSSSLSGVTTGGNNVGVGYNAGVGITGAPDNTIVGGQAFGGSATSATSGYNTAVGAYAMNVSSGAAFNTAIGRDAGRELTTGDYNVFLGYNAAANDSSAGITTGSGNVIIGTIDPASRTGSHQFKIANYDGSSTVTWIDGDSSGNLTFPADVTLGDDLNLDSDSAVLTFGDDQEITLTHVHNAGLLLNSSYYLTFRDSALAISSSTDGQLDIDADTEVEIATTTLDLNGALDVSGASQFSGAITVGVDDTGLDVKLFGAAAGAYGLYDQSENAFEVRGATAAGAGLLKLTTGELTVVDADKLGRIDFQAPLESDGTDAVAIAASIWAEADDTFSSSVNNTDLVFALGKSEAAAEKFRLTADGEIGLGGANYGTDGQVLTSAGAGAAAAWEDAAGGITGKEGGTNFTGSLKIGDTTTGTLNAAQYNIGIGKYSLSTISSGDYNTAVGGVSINALSTGTGNSALGYSALQNVTGDKNIGLGYQSGNNITSGSGNVVIGNADVSSATADDQLSISDGEDGSVVWMTGDSSANIVLAADLTIGDDFLMTSDSSVITFGADSDTTLTHTDGTGLTLNGTNKLCFYDTALSIHSSTDGQLDLIADTEIQIAATTIDINGAVDISGNITFGGLVDVNGVADGLVLDANGNTTISSPTDDQIDFEIAGADDFTMTANTFTILAGSTIVNSGTMSPDISSTGKAMVLGF